MSDKINFKLLKPFGSTLAKAELPLQLISDFLKDLKENKLSQPNYLLIPVFRKFP